MPDLNVPNPTYVPGLADDYFAPGLAASSFGKINDPYLVNPTVAKDSGQDHIFQLANEMGLKLDNQTKDYLVQYYLDEQKAQNTQLRQTQAEKDYYPNLVEGLRKAGINPMMVLSGLSGGGTGASSGSTSGGLYTQHESNKANQKTSLISRVLMMVAAVAAAVIAA